MENNACDKNSIAKKTKKNKVFVEFYRNSSDEQREKKAAGNARRPLGQLYEFKYFSSRRETSRRSMGLEMWAFMPASRHR